MSVFDTLDLKGNEYNFMGVNSVKIMFASSKNDFLLYRAQLLKANSAVN